MDLSRRVENRECTKVSEREWPEEREENWEITVPRRKAVWKRMNNSVKFGLAKKSA